MKQVVWRPLLAVLVAAAICGGALSVAHADGDVQGTAPAVKAEAPKAATPAAPAVKPEAPKVVAPAAPAAPTAPAVKAEPVKVPAPTPAPAAAAAPGTSPYTTEFVQGNDFDKWCESIKKPCNWFNWGADFQFRNVYSNNTTTLNQDSVIGAGKPHAGEQNHETEYSRYRARIWSTFNLNENVEFNSRFQWEAFTFYEPEYKEGTTNSQGLFDNLNFKFKNMFDTKSALTVGRQDIFLGDGWLVADGTPYDGSLTSFFDAARLTFEMPDISTTADLMYIYNTANPNTWLHPINGETPPFWNAEQDEQGAVAYFTNKSVENTEISPYFMYKKASTISQISNGYNAELYTPGLRIARKIDENWKWRGEAAYQFGDSDKATGTYTQDVRAWGANTALQYFTHDEMDNNFRLQYEYLSGDEPGSSGKYEGFDVMWGRWARWSDAYADMTVLEQNGRKADYSNLHRIGPGWSFNPCDKFTLATDYYLLFADQSANKDAIGTDDQGFSNNGFFRGQMITSVLSYKFNKHVSGHLQGELFFPGNYYSNDRNDIASFLRYQLVLTF